MSQPIKHWSIIAISGPDTEAKRTRHDMLSDGIYNKVVAFGHPDDYGSYPDTTGYYSDNWEDIELLDEDGNLFQHMTKCMDAVLEYVNNKYKRACTDYPGIVEKSIHWPKQGGKMFFVTGHVTVQPGQIGLLH
jgi:hypothetical protein